MNVEINDNSLIRVTGEQVTADLADEEVVILNLKDKVYYGLNPIGGHVWKLVQEPKTFREIRDTLLQEYDVEPEVCTRDLLALLSEMQERGLIEVGEKPAD